MHRENRQRLKIPKIRLIKRQEIWILTVQGWVIFIATITFVIFFTITHLYSFLAVNSPIQSAQVLVVEGWMTDYAIEQAFVEFQSGSYRQIITTGTPVERGFYLAEYKNFAEIAAATLKKLGVQKEKLVVIPSPNVLKDRTQASAIKLRHWLSNSNLQLESINLFTSDVHARRSWLIFKKILTPHIKVGVIAAKNKNYDASKWWVSSEGVRTVISETIAYIYAVIVNGKA